MLCVKMKKVSEVVRRPKSSFSVRVSLEKMRTYTHPIYCPYRTPMINLRMRYIYGVGVILNSIQGHESLVLTTRGHGADARHA